MFINAGARGMLLTAERQKFLTEEWPRIYANIQRLGLKADELLNSDGSPQKAASPKSTHPSPPKEKR